MAPSGVRPVEGDGFNKQKHVNYWKRCLKTFLPSAYTSTDSNRMLLAFFIVCSLDLLGALHGQTTQAERAGYIEWIYNCQLPDGGFRGFPGADFGGRRSEQNRVWDPANVPATYLALSALLILRDGLERVKRRECLQWLRKLQRPNGSFGQTLGADGAIEGGTDSRFGYCACMARFILRGAVLGDVDGVPDIDVDSLVACIRESQTYDGGISEAPFHEAHGGFTYCALGALSLLRRLPPEITDKGPAPAPGASGLSNLDFTISWLVSCQTELIEEKEAADAEVEPAADSTKSALGEPSRGSGVLPDASETLQHEWAGFNGRCNKIADTCYCFWVGGGLSLLHKLDLSDKAACRRYLLDKTQHMIGGFGKNPGDAPDIYHSCLGLAALSLLGHADVKPVVPSACFSQDTARFLESLPWRRQITGDDTGLPQGFTYSAPEMPANSSLNDIAASGG